MLKKDLTALVQQLRAENSLLRTQLDAARQAQQPEQMSIGRAARVARSAAIDRLALRYPGRRSFSHSEVAQEITCSA